MGEPKGWRQPSCKGPPMPGEEFELTLGPSRAQCCVWLLGMKLRERRTNQQDLKSGHRFRGEYRALINTGCPGLRDPTGSWSPFPLVDPLLAPPPPSLQRAKLQTSPFLQHTSSRGLTVPVTLNTPAHSCTPKDISIAFPRTPALPATPSLTACGQPWCGERVGGHVHVSPTTADGPQSSAPHARCLCSSRALRALSSTPTDVLPDSEAPGWVLPHHSCSAHTALPHNASPGSLSCGPSALPSSGTTRSVVQSPLPFC